jgi:hypothetical protein
MMKNKKPKEPPSILTAGVHTQSNGRYIAVAMSGRRKKFLGTFSTAEAAQQAIDSFSNKTESASINFLHS